MMNDDDGNDDNDYDKGDEDHYEWKTYILALFDVDRIACTYFVHYGYCATAEAFSKATSQSVDEDLTSIKHRQCKTTQQFFLV
jgi:hypothetical protein